MDCQLYKDNPGRENIIKVWKDYTIEDAIIVIEKLWKPWSLRQWSFDAESADVVHDFAGLTAESIKEHNMKETVDMPETAKGRQSGFQDVSLLEKFSLAW